MPLPSHLLNLPIHEAIYKELEKLFIDKVIANLGLCISVYDIRSIEGGFIFPGDGAPTYTGSLDHDGLGPVSWWFETEEIEEE